MISWFPESPRYLAMVGRPEEALVSLARLHARGDTEDLFVRTELEDIMRSVEEEAILSKSACVEPSVDLRVQLILKVGPQLPPTLHDPVQPPSTCSRSHPSVLGTDDVRRGMFHSIGVLLASLPGSSAALADMFAFGWAAGCLCYSTSPRQYSLR